MSLNLTELKDESLGKQPIQAAVCWYSCIGMHLDAQQDVVAADDESSFTFDVEGLGDEALDDSPSVSADSCLPGSCLCYADGLGDEALDIPHTLTAQACSTCTLCFVKHRT